MITKENRSSIYAVLSGFLYSFMSYFGLSAMQNNLSASTMLFWRFLIASLVIIIFLLPFKKNKDSLKQMCGAFFIGAIFYSFSAWLYFSACHYISSGMAMVIFFTYPVFIMFLNFVFYKNRIPPIYYLSILLILAGMICLVDVNELSLNLWGIFISIISSLFYAFYIIASKKIDTSPSMSTLMVCLGCMTTNLIISMFTGSLVMPVNNTWLYLGGIAIIATAAPIILMLYSLKHISSEKASILSVLEPVFVVIFGVLLLGETLKLLNTLGIVLILLGALTTLFSDKITTYMRTPWI